MGKKVNELCWELCKPDSLAEGQLGLIKPTLTSFFFPWCSSRLFGKLLLFYEFIFCKSAKVNRKKQRVVG
jgi:hypothetical protein